MVRYLWVEDRDRYTYGQIVIGRRQRLINIWSDSYR